jgi:hypothetical protein
MTEETKLLIISKKSHILLTCKEKSRANSELIDFFALIKKLILFKINQMIYVMFICMCQQLSSNLYTQSK